jgi:putative transposase
LIKEAIQCGARQKQACAVLGLSSRTYQRWIKADVISDGRLTTKRPAPANKLSEDERQQILTVCNKPLYAHLPPYQIVPRLADQGIYLASESSFYRILKAENQLTHRGNVKVKTKSNKVRHFTATKPNQVWSWDITYCPSRIIG